MFEFPLFPRGRSVAPHKISKKKFNKKPNLIIHFTLKNTGNTFFSIVYIYKGREFKHLKFLCTMNFPRTNSIVSILGLWCFIFQQLELGGNVRGHLWSYRVRIRPENCFGKPGGQPCLWEKAESVFFILAANSNHLNCVRKLQLNVGIKRL